MDAIDLEALDAKIETERQWLVSTFRRIADRLEAMSVEEVIEPLTMISEPANALIRRAETALKVPLGSPPARPR